MATFSQASPSAIIPHVVDHPAHHERTLAIRIGIIGDLRRGRCGVVGGDLECETDERVRQGHEEVGNYGGESAPEGELPELEGRVARGGVHELHMNWEEKGEGEEGDNNQVDETDGH